MPFGTSGTTREVVMANIPVDTTGLGIYLTLPAGALYTTIAGPGAWGTRPIFVK